MTAQTCWFNVKVNSLISNFFGLLKKNKQFFGIIYYLYGDTKTVKLSLSLNRKTWVLKICGFRFDFKIYVYEFFFWKQQNLCIWIKKTKTSYFSFFFVLSIKLLSMYMNYLFFCPVVVGVVCRKCEITVGIEWGGMGARDENEPNGYLVGVKVCMQAHGWFKAERFNHQHRFNCWNRSWAIAWCCCLCSFKGRRQYAHKGTYNYNLLSQVNQL